MTSSLSTVSCQPYTKKQWDKWPAELDASVLARLPVRSNRDDKYFDDKYEYRHVMLPKDLAKMVPRTHLMSESEWRSLGVQQSQGWVHYMAHEPEPHILLFRRPLPAN